MGRLVVALDAGVRSTLRISRRRGTAMKQPEWSAWLQWKRRVAAPPGCARASGDSASSKPGEQRCVHDVEPTGRVDCGPLSRTGQNLNWCNLPTRPV